MSTYAYNIYNKAGTCQLFPWVKIFYQMDHFYIGLFYSPALKLHTRAQILFSFKQEEQL